MGILGGSFDLALNQWFSVFSLVGTFGNVLETFCCHEVGGRWGGAAVGSWVETKVAGELARRRVAYNSKE